ncbi:hypothetical protein [Chryseobacterium jejuense]|uniref:Lipocalin-like domain-containing protein n=1 Tax=Chryseobacterium jejuense TaxID=445960 RepID=A0A2X2VFQ9_CHRJE|nr:hypothetical protein [Chryseobacterium jejuense]SDI90937.1 hypothetical protein SAMN05421542_2214 [Chryseobacterium jejuense]SQB27428.1 Uncharacterised protein [Chryseobacterium jejuense]
MKKSFLIFLLLFFGLCFSQTEKDLYGKWVGTDAGSYGSFTFFSDGFVKAELEGLNIDGRNHVIPDGPNKGKIGHVKYTADFSKKIIKFNLIGSYNDFNNKLEESKFLSGLIKFINEDELLLFFDFENETPADIDPASPNVITLRREKGL